MDRAQEKFVETKSHTDKAKRALLIGINYTGTSGELQGCCNDVQKMKAFLLERGWAAGDMLILTDDQHQPQKLPTKANMLDGMRWLVRGAAAGDLLFFHFSGHGGQEVDTHGDEEDGMDETICPLDFTVTGQICDDLIFATLAAPLPAGCRLTILLDCCHSGHGMDAPYTLWHDDRGTVAWNRDVRARPADGDVVCFSGCEDDDCSADATCSQGTPAGAMTSAFLDVLGAAPRGLTYPALHAALTDLLIARGFSQRPEISATQPFALHRPVSLTDALPPTAPLGLVVHVPRPPRQRREFEGGFQEMLTSAASGYIGAAVGAQLAQLAHSSGGGGNMGSGGGGGGLFGSWFGGGAHVMEAEKAPAPPKEAAEAGLMYEDEDDAYDEDDYDEGDDYDDYDDDDGDY